MKELNLLCFILNLVITALVGVFLSIIPTLTRKSFLFGVKVPPEQSDSAEAREMKRRYVAVCLCGTAVVLGLDVVQFVVAPDMTLLACMYFPLLFVVIQMAAFVPNWKAALKLKEECGWQVSSAVFAETGSSFSRGRLSAMPWVWYALGVAVCAISAVVALSVYPSLPDVLPIHFDINGNANGWAQKSIGAVLQMPLFNLVMVIFLCLVGVLVEKAKLQIDAHNAALSFAQHRAYRKIFGHSLGFLSFSVNLLFMLISFSTLWEGFSVAGWIMMALIVVPCALVCVVSVLVGQGGCKLKPSVSAAESFGVPTSSKVSPSSDDRFWALGMFYHNPNDPAHIVEDRFGGNIGFNYSRLSVKIGMIVTVAAIIGSYVWITLIVLY